MTRDQKTAQEIKDLAASAQRLRVALDGFEDHAASQRADLHAVLYGKVSDALVDAHDALAVAADLMDPDVTDIEDMASEDSGESPRFTLVVSFDAEGKDEAGAYAYLKGVLEVGDDEQRITNVDIHAEDLTSH